MPLLVTVFYWLHQRSCGRVSRFLFFPSVCEPSTTLTWDMTVEGSTIYVLSSRKNNRMMECSGTKGISSAVLFDKCPIDTSSSLPPTWLGSLLGPDHRTSATRGSGVGPQPTVLWLFYRFLFLHR